MRFTGFRDRPLHERQAKFQHSLREGNIEMSVLSNGFAFSLIWNVLENGYLDPHAMTRIDFHKERGKVRIMKAEPSRLFLGIWENVDSKMFREIPDS